MDRTFQVAIGVCIVLFLITLNIFFRDSVEHGVRNAWSHVTGSQSVAATAPAPAPPPDPAPKPRAKPRKPHQSDPEPQPEPDLAQKEPSAAARKIELPPPPFPTATDLRSGMTKREMMTRFGAPRFTASWSEGGALSEKFIYTHDEQVTAVILRDGQVVISRTGQNDPWARSAWWQTGSRSKAEPAEADGPKAH